jgi:DNA-binding CsgD family transcriptional regulator
MHPIVTRRMNKILDMWASFMTTGEIAECLDISLDCVKRHLERARRRGDPRSNRPEGIHARQLRKSVRAAQMRTMRKAGFSPSEIAKRLDVHVRLVQMRLKEA